MRRALDQFPVAGRSPIASGTRTSCRAARPRAKPFKPVPLHDVADPPELVELCIVANFVEVWLAREGHANPVGINYLEKIQIPHLPSLYGAMLAGVDYVLMGAGIPSAFPGVLDRLGRHEAASYPLARGRRTPMSDDRRCRSIPRVPVRRRLPPLDAAGLPRHRLVARARGGAPQARQRRRSTASSSKARPPAGTTRRRAASCS